MLKMTEARAVQINRALLSYPLHTFELVERTEDVSGFSLGEMLAAAETVRGINRRARKMNHPVPADWLIAAIYALMHCEAQNQDGDLRPIISGPGRSLICLSTAGEG
jgi:hypothetical protein